MGLEELKMLFSLGGPTAVLAWVLYVFVKEIKPALDRNTEALGMVAQVLAERKLQLPPAAAAAPVIAMPPLGGVTL